jgi:uncharacterized protein involved in exopolysaccharide biosynthesis
VLSVSVPATPVENEFSMGPDGGESEEGGLSMQQVQSIVWAHRYLTLLIFCAIVVPTVLVAKFLLPKTYAATATLMVNYEINDPLAGKDANAELMNNYMSTRIQLMQSAEVLKPVIEKLQLTQDKTFTAGFSGDPRALVEYVQEGLAKTLDIEQGALGSQLLNVTALARDPVKAAQIANTVSEVYAEQELSRQTGPATDRALRYAQQLSELKAKVNLAQEQVTAFRQRTGVTADINAQNNVEADLLASLEQRYQEAQNQRRAAEVRAGSDQSTSSAYMASNVVQQLKTKVATLEGQLAQMSATMGPLHPKVKELKSELESTRQTLAEESRTYSSGVNADLTASRQLEEKLRSAVEQQRVKVLNVRRLQDEGTKYLLELESAQSVYKRALDGYDEIMFAKGGHTTNVNFVSRAVPPLRAAKPNKLKILLMGMIAGLGIGFAAPLGYELFFNRRVRCADDLERGFSIPVLIELDELPAVVEAA